MKMRWIIIRTGSAQGSQVAVRKHYDKALADLKVFAVRDGEKLQLWDNVMFRKVAQCDRDGNVTTLSQETGR